MEDLDPTFVNRVVPGDIMVAGYNFGCGSSREHAPLVIKESAIAVVIAKSFARIFYRNAINIGLPIVECPEAVDEINEGDVLSCDLTAGIITNTTTGKQYKTEPFPAFINSIIEAGGLIEAIKQGKIK
jgi:3-isopropylmalate/(R)-2-methylmalate dehydratase small subunit